MVGAAAYFGAKLAHGSSSRMLRNSFAIRAAAMFSPLLALPATPFAPLFLIASAMLGAIGFASGSLAANERLFRLISGPAVIRHHARYLARTSGAMTIGQLGGAAVIAGARTARLPGVRRPVRGLDGVARGCLPTGHGRIRADAHPGTKAAAR